MSRTPARTHPWSNIRVAPTSQGQRYPDNTCNDESVCASGCVLSGGVSLGSKVSSTQAISDKHRRRATTFNEACDNNPMAGACPDERKHNGHQHAWASKGWQSRQRGQMTRTSCYTLRTIWRTSTELQHKRPATIGLLGSQDTATRAHTSFGNNPQATRSKSSNASLGRRSPRPTHHERHGHSVDHDTKAELASGLAHKCARLHPPAPVQARQS